MTDRERLIEKIKLSEKQELIDFFTADLVETIEMPCGTQFNGTVEKLADYLLEHGVIVPLCKVGDTVYAYDVYFYEIHDFRITQKVLYDGAPTIYTGECRNGDVMLSDITFTDSDIGNTVFLTREEAEKALKERDGS